MTGERNYDEIRARYVRLHTVAFELNKPLTEYVSNAELESTAKKLGFWSNGTLVFEQEDQAAVLFDHAIHRWYPHGHNAVSRYVADHPPAPGTDEAVVLEAKRRPFYALFQVKSAVRGVGVHVLDVLRNDEHFLADVGFSQTAREDVALATRALRFGDFIATTGAALPVDPETLPEIRHVLTRHASVESLDELSPKQMDDLTSGMIRACLRGRGSSRIIYADPGQPPPSRDFGGAYPERTSGKTRVGRNDPCPCGSGRKYKKCCGGGPIYASRRAV